MLKYFALGCSSLALIAAIGCGGSESSGRYTTDSSPASQKTAGDVAATKSDESFFIDSASPVVPDAETTSSTPASRKMAPPADRLRGESEKVIERFVPESRKNKQSGLLTAGSFDDVFNFGDFQSFLSRHRHSGSYRQSAWMPAASSCQTLITVTDEQGRPIGNARCKVSLISQNQRQPVLLDMTTGSDGKVMLMADQNTIRHSNGLRLQVWSPNSQELLVDESRQPERKWDVTAAACESNLPTTLDLALVIDTTGSMGDELEYLKTEIDSIVESVNKMFPNVDQRYSLITYRDNGDQYVSRSFDFTSSLTDFRKNLDQQSAQGGGDFPEAMDAALKNAEQLSWRKDNTARVMFLIGDAPPHQENIANAMNAVTALRDKGVRIFPVGASGVETTAQIVMRTSAFLTMGQYLFLTDHSGVGNAHATPDVPEFAVERLDRLMVRMIASELAGKRLVPEEVLAIERGELQTSNLHCRPRHVAICQPIPYTDITCCVPSPLASASITVRHSSLFSVFSWIGRHGLTVLVALVSGILVFDNLTSRNANR